MDPLVLLAIVAPTIRISVPYLLAALGGTFSERGGVVNIALEGILLAGAFSATVATHYSHSPWVGLLAGVGGGVLLALLHAFVTVTCKADQIISGLAINMLSLGGTKFLLKLIFGSTSNSPRIEGLAPWQIGDPAAGPGFTTTLLGLADTLANPLVLITGAILVASQWTLFRTVFGLRLRAVGEHPEAADSLGISVSRMRYLGVLAGGALAGLGGAWLAFDQHQFTSGMSGGRGYIALAAMIVGKWKPLGALAACLLFGFAETLQIKLQGGRIPADLLQMLPHLLTIVVLCGWIGRSTPPAADGVPYEKERTE